MRSPTYLVVCTTCGATNRTPTGKTLSAGQCGACKARLASAKPVEISANILNRLLSRDEGSFVLDVWAPWCGPCRMMAPAFEQAAQYYEGRLRFLKLNTEAYPEAGVALGVRGIPSVLVYQSGSKLDQKSGVMSASMLIDWVDGLPLFENSD